MNPTASLPTGAFPSEPFEVGPWRVEPLGLRLVRLDGTEARLEPRVMSLLVQLVVAAGRPVTHEALVATVWAGAFVSADAVHGAVSKLRRVLEQDLPSGSAIETLPRVGYRLRLPVRGATSGEVAATPGRRRVVWAAVVAVAAGLAAVALRRPAPRTPRPLAPVVRPITSFPGLEVDPAFPPRGPGDRVAFAWKGPSQEQWDVYVTVVGGGPPLRLTHDPAADRHPVWSPDATRIAFVRRSGSDCGIFSVAALGGDERRIGACREPVDLAFSADGRTLLLADRPSPESTYRLLALDVASGETRPVVEPPARGMGDHSVAPAPTGSAIAFLRSPVLGVEDLWLREGSGELRRLTHDELKIHGFDWLPDGRSLVVSSNRGGLFGLWRVPVGGGEPRWLGAGGGELEAPTVSGDGRRVAFEEWREETNLYRVDLGRPAEPPRRVVASTRCDFQPALSPDGRRLAFVSDRSGSSELWTASADGVGPVQRTRFGGAYVTSPHWSPDGRRLVFDVRAEGRGDLWLLDADAEAPRRLTATSASDLAPTWSRDGRSVLFASDRSGAWELWRLDTASGVAQPLTRGGGYRGVERADGTVVFCRADRPGLWTLPPGGAEAQPLVDDLAPVDRANWALAGDDLVYVSRRVPERPEIVRMDLRTGRRKVVGPLRDFPFTSGIALSPDAGWAVLARIDRRESDLLVMDLPPEG